MPSGRHRARSAGDSPFAPGESALAHVADSEPGIRRIAHGKGFRYLDADGRPVHDAATRRRIDALAIPPAWRDVWICSRGNGHLQATGRDARGRKQYRYHPAWTALRGREKFGRIERFGERLPGLRRTLRRDLGLAGFPQRKVIAIVVAVMADTLARIGNAGYARSNGSYGLTTLRNRHVRFLRGGRARFRFRGKGGIAQEMALDDARLVRLVRRCQQLPGQHLFQYRDDDGEAVPVGSTQVNDYLRDAMGDAFSAKDFRTWGGTLAAVRCLAGMPRTPGQGEQAARREVEACVAAQLGNTPAVCRKSYIDPRVYQAWADGWLARASTKARGARQWERVTLRLLHRYRAKPG